ncbi:phosphatase PAP2 family protein [Heliobacterium chlorum]|uniref:Phosphatase PAP2 family protein n=1 Tax=Heliobacterium chlorum TaxID=2698 RepID=A0ABR7T5I0_HELCL|nr:phosphatase PAP2 family protein [Heliobacterium chlorum]MBC9785625.1 phosphatase PAP2 family protein [Heliobacterium chlorum]
MSRWRSDNLNEFMGYITCLGSAKVLVPATLLAGLYGIKKGEPYSLQILTSSLVAWGLLNFPLKYLFGRIRPDVVPALALEASPSFPSGHTLGIALVLPAVVFVLTGQRHRKVGALFTGVVILLVSMSRLYLSVHWPSDVIASLLAASVYWHFICPFDKPPASYRIDEVRELKKGSSV